MASVVGGAISGGSIVLKESYNCLKPHYDYVNDLDKNYVKLINEWGYLSAKKRDMAERINRSGDAMRTTNQWDHLTAKVRSTEAKIQNINAEYRNFQRFLRGMWPFFKLRKLGKHIIETTEEVVREKNEMEELFRHENVMTESRAELVAADIVELNSLHKNVQKLLRDLGNEEVRRIGIWGREGIGKTTLLKKLSVEANKNGRFDIVIFVAFRRDDSVTKIQEDLLKQLNLSVNGIDSKEQVAATISSKLERIKYLVLFDKFVSNINLDDVGIRGCHKYGKVLFASTQKSIFTNMDVSSLFHVKSLPPEDAWTLFRTTVGVDLENRPRIQEIAERIVKELGGLPRLIKAVARNLRNDDSESTWNNTLWTLQKPTESPPEFLQEEFKVLKLVYDQLYVDRRQCLLYAALFPSGYEIHDDYLVECWRIERFIQDVQVGGRWGNDHPFGVAREKGHEILKNLTELSLLERCWRVKHIKMPKQKYVKMPEQFRKMALHIFYPKEGDCELLVAAGEQIEEHPTEEKWRPANRISLMCNRLNSLPESPKCNKISTLLIQRNIQLRSIPKSFFAHMCKLQFLDLSETEIESLPPSLFSLINLKGLYLNDCRRLAVLSSKIAKLQNLEVLDIRGTSIRSLPVEVGQLSNLKCFRVSFLYNSEDSLNTPKSNFLQLWKHEKLRVVIPRNVVKKLQQLEELTVIVRPEEQSWEGIVNDIAKEVASLNVLTTLCFYFPSADSLTTFIALWNGKKFRSFTLLVGQQGNQHYVLKSSVGSSERLLRYSAGEDTIPDTIGKVLRQATAFELIGHRNVQSLSDFDMKNMKSLEVCVIEECNDMRSIVDGCSNVHGSVFPLLEELRIMNLQQLNCIWRGPVKPGSLVNLRTLTLNGCPSLTKILLIGITQQLQKLQSLTVENCSQITEIIEAENHSEITTITEDDNLSGSFPKLEILKLVNLQSLVSICGSETLDWPSLEKIVIKGCPMLTSLSLSTTNARELSSISCNKHWWETLQHSLQDGLRRRLELLCCFNDEEQPSMHETPPNPKFVHNQPPDLDTQVDMHVQNRASSSMTAAIAERPIVINTSRVLTQIHNNTENANTNTNVKQAVAQTEKNRGEESQTRSVGVAQHERVKVAVRRHRLVARRASLAVARALLAVRWRVGGVAQSQSQSRDLKD